MSDRDLALEAAWDEYGWEPNSREPVEVFAAGFAAGKLAAFRSLGAGTPEAQAALRKLVRAAADVGCNCVCSADGFCQTHAHQMLDASCTFAAFATPTEEGR